MATGSIAQAEVLVVGSRGFEPYAQGSSLVAFLPKAIVSPEQPASKTDDLHQPRAVIPARDVFALIGETALRYGGDPALVAAGVSVSDWLALFQANIEIESAYRVDAKSLVGAYGLGQLMPDTAKQLGVDPKVPAQNLDGSARYLLAMMARFGSAELALAAYNAGPEAVARYGGIPPFKETQNHVRRVLHVFARLTGKVPELEQAAKP